MVARLTFEVLEGCSAAQVSLEATGSYNYALGRVTFDSKAGTVYGNLLAAYDGETGQITVENLPDSVQVLAAAYEDGKMIWSGTMPSDESLMVPEKAQDAQITLFFLWNDWRPAGTARKLK